ncbi:MAG: hypothetical protein HQL31_10555 [Planctomycetes bacterium]|nr:hypothetical protein [Planctomycetota bacterium]
MGYGLWRYKWEAWTPRPVYFYFAALLETIRPGCHIRRIDGLPVSVVGVRLGEDNAGYSQTLVLLNHGPDTVKLNVPATGPAKRLRISPERLPHQPDAPVHATSADDVPLHDWAPLAAANGRIDLDPGELTLVSGNIA